MHPDSTPEQSNTTTEKRNDGRFKKGEHRSPATEFKPGTHWRKRKPFWDRAWLVDAYVTQGQSCSEIAEEFGVTEEAVYFWLRKHDIPRRTVAEARALKHWGAVGVDNPMYGHRGKKNHNWKGGVAPERQAYYSRYEWRLVSDAVWLRDHSECQRCGAKGEGARLEIHHIVPFEVPELRAEPSNLILLCVKCHRWVHSKANVNFDLIDQGRRSGE